MGVAAAGPGALGLNRTTQLMFNDDHFNIVAKLLAGGIDVTGLMCAHVSASLPEHFGVVRSSPVTVLHNDAGYKAFWHFRSNKKISIGPFSILWIQQFESISLLRQWHLDLS